MDTSLLAERKARRASPAQQVRTLVVRKELLLKRRRSICTTCELSLPIVLCGLVLLSKLAPDTQVGQRAADLPR